jgi:succinyl-CoA synthetase beta subunit
MNIHEYQAKEIMRKYGVPTSHGVVILREKDIDTVIDNFDAPLYVVKVRQKLRPTICGVQFL